MAYLTTEYPAVSHTFIRRELREIERLGHHVLRLAIRPTDTPLADPVDRDEHEKTLHCLAQPILNLLLAPARVFLTRPRRFLAALRLALAMGRRSERGLLRNLAYLAEACYLLSVLCRQDVEHVHVHFGTNSVDVARLIRRLGGPSYSFTVHGPDEFDAPRGLDLAGKIADCAFVVAITDYCAAQLRRWAPIEDWTKTHVVHCTVGDDFFGDAQPIEPSSNTFVCVGRLAPQKGQLLLINALAEVVRAGGDTRLVLVGDGELRSEIQRRIAAHDLNDRVEITGYVSEAEVRRHILASLALVQPSFAEGLPMVIMEAFALGRPVVSTYIAGIPELVRPGENGWLVPSGNVEQLAEALRAVMEAPARKLDEMATAGRLAVLERHNAPNEAQRLERLFVGAVETQRDRGEQ